MACAMPVFLFILLLEHKQQFDEQKFRKSEIMDYTISNRRTIKLTGKELRCAHFEQS